jgi:hypothetical protein
MIVLFFVIFQGDESFDGKVKNKNRNSQEKSISFFTFA